MKVLLRFAAWATLGFTLAWFIQHPYQHVIQDLTGSVMSLWGSGVEWGDQELFYPFDISVFLALCLASKWTPWPRRLRAIAIGVPILVVVEVLTLVAIVQIMQSAQSQSPEQQDAAGRFAVELVRVTGLVAAACVWLWMLAAQELPRFAARLMPATPVPARKSSR